MSTTNPEELAAADVAAPVETAEPIAVTGISLDVASDAGVASFTKLNPELTGSDREQEILKLLRKSQSAGAVLELVQGELLSEVKGNEYWKHYLDADGVPYANFDKFVSEELNIKPKTAYNRIATYEALVIKAKLTAAQLATVSLSKIPFVSKYITEETAPAILGALETLSFRDMPQFAQALANSSTVEDAVKVVVDAKAAKLVGPSDSSAAEPTAAAAAAPGGGGGGESEGVKSFTIKMSASQHQSCMSAIETIMASLGTGSQAQALEHALLECVSGLPSGPMSGEDKKLAVAKLLDVIERTHGVKLSIVSLVGED